MSANNILTAMLTLNITLALLAPIFFSTYFTPSPSDLNSLNKIQDLRENLTNLFEWLIGTCIGILFFIFFLHLFNSKCIVPSKALAIILMCFLITFLIFTTRNSIRTINFIKKSLGLTIDINKIEGSNASIINIIISSNVGVTVTRANGNIRLKNQLKKDNKSVKFDIYPLDWIFTKRLLKILKENV